MGSTFSTCKKGGPACANTVYSFEMGARAYPDRDNIFMGDTLWIEINTPTSLTDIATNNVIDYGGAENLGSAIGFAQYSGKDTIIDAANFFDYYLIAGVQVNNPQVSKIREYLFVQRNNNYAFKLGIIPKQKGVFGIGFSNAANVYRNFDKCTKASFQLFFENTHQHYYLNPNIKGSNFDTTKPSGSYYFKVY